MINPKNTTGRGLGPGATRLGLVADNPKRSARATRTGVSLTLGPVLCSRTTCEDARSTGYSLLTYHDKPLYVSVGDAYTAGLPGA